MSKIIIQKANAKSKTDLKEIDVELDWIQGVRKQVEFLNANMNHHCIYSKYRGVNL